MGAKISENKILEANQQGGFELEITRQLGLLKGTGERHTQPSCEKRPQNAHSVP